MSSGGNLVCNVGGNGLPPRVQDLTSLCFSSLEKLAEHAWKRILRTWDWARLRGLLVEATLFYHSEFNILARTSRVDPGSARQFLEGWREQWCTGNAEVLELPWYWGRAQKVKRGNNWEWRAWDGGYNLRSEYLPLSMCPRRPRKQSFH